MSKFINIWYICVCISIYVLLFDSAVWHESLSQHIPKDKITTTSPFAFCAFRNFTFAKRKQLNITYQTYSFIVSDSDPFWKDGWCHIGRCCVGVKSSYQIAYCIFVCYSIYWNLRNMWNIFTDWLWVPSANCLFQIVQCSVHERQQIYKYNVVLALATGIQLMLHMMTVIQMRLKRKNYVNYVVMVQGTAFSIHHLAFTWSKYKYFMEFHLKMNIKHQRWNADDTLHFHNFTFLKPMVCVLGWMLSLTLLLVSLSISFLVSHRFLRHHGNRNSSSYYYYFFFHNFFFFLLLFLVSNHLCE